MDWKEYKEIPDEGMFEAIQKRLRVRRAWRIGGGVAVVVLVAAVAIAMLTHKEETVVSEQETAVLAEPQEALVAEVQEAADFDVTTDEMSAKQSQNTQTDALLPEPQMQVVAVAEPNDERVTSSASFTMPTVRPRTAKVVSEKPAVVQSTETKESVDVAHNAAAVLEPKFGGTETPTTYHEDNILWTPNIITPNGDEPENRVFRVIATSELQDFRMHIYNRGGRLIFRTSDINATWDATVNGAALPQGAYVWVATFRDSEGVPRREAGTVTVVR